MALSLEMIALTIFEVESMAERRIVKLIDPALSGLPVSMVPDPGVNFRFIFSQVIAAPFVAGKKLHAAPASEDSIMTPANREDRVSIAVHVELWALPMAKSFVAMPYRITGGGARVRFSCAAGV